MTGKSSAEWRQVRSVLNRTRYELSLRAAELYPGVPRVAGTPLLCRPGWVPDRPLPLESIDLRWAAGAAPAEVTGREPESAAVRPVQAVRPDGKGREGRGSRGSRGGGESERFASYSAAMAELAAPAVFEDRRSYRLLAADLRGPAVLRFAAAGYFAGLDVKEALAHELAAVVGDTVDDTVRDTVDGAVRAEGAATHDRAGPGLPELPFRALVGDPCDLSRHPAVPAITTVTIRHDRRAGTAEFLLHWRDPAKVAHGGGLYQVMPVGVFQPVTGSADDERRDLDLWRCMAREFSEELLGTGEDYGPEFRYASWPFFGDLARARRSGRLTVHCLGLGVDPLTLAVDILTVAVFDAEAFDALFQGLVPANAEGLVQRIPLPDAGPFITGERPMQAAGAAALGLTLRHQSDIYAFPIISP